MAGNFTPLPRPSSAEAARGRLVRQVVVLRSRLSGRPAWTNYRGTPLGWRTVKTTLAAVLAYELARRLLRGGPVPLLAPLTALLVAQITVVETLKSGLERVGSVVAGVLIAVMLSKVVGLTWWGLGIVIFASLIVGELLRLGDQRIEVPISAMLVLAVTGQTQVAAQSRILETLIGAVTGVALNAALGPPVYVRPAADAVSNLSNHLAGLLQAMGEELTEGWSSERARGWVHQMGELDRPLRSAEAALTRGEESLRLNPRRRRVLQGTLSLRAGLAALEHVAVQIRGICRDLADLAERVEERGQAEPEILIALGRLLVELGGGVAAFGQLVAPDIAGPPREAVPLHIALEIARTHRDVLAELMLVDARTDPELWHVQGSLLANADRLLREIDLERGADARHVRHR
jgi:uncharacterized membrane protein YgaE (UPF0421/DUF939 family)